MILKLQVQPTHIFREGNSVADALAGEVVESQNFKEYYSFLELPSKTRKLINMDKSQIPSIRIRARKINKQ